MLPLCIPWLWRRKNNEVFRSAIKEKTMDEGQKVGKWHHDLCSCGHVDCRVCRCALWFFSFRWCFVFFLFPLFLLLTLCSDLVHFRMSVRMLSVDKVAFSCAARKASQVRDDGKLCSLLILFARCCSPLPCLIMWVGLWAGECVALLNCEKISTRLQKDTFRGSIVFGLE